MSKHDDQYKYGGKYEYRGSDEHDEDYETGEKHNDDLGYAWTSPISTSEGFDYSPKGSKSYTLSAQGPAGNGTLFNSTLGLIEVRHAREDVETTIYQQNPLSSVQGQVFRLETLEHETGADKDYYHFSFGNVIASGINASPTQVVTGANEWENGRWSWDFIHSNESYTVAVLNGQSLIVHVERGLSRVEFDVYSDRNGDGWWEEVASGSTQGMFYDAQTNQIDLAGISRAGFLGAELM